MSQLDKHELVNYLKYRHMKNFDKKISSIKLHKSLYFMFAYWGTFIMQGKGNVEENVDDFDCFLFDADFRSWAFGPVDQEIYETNKNSNSYKSKQAKRFYANQDNLIKDFFEYIIPQIFNSSDFGLIDLCQKDKCWKDRFNRDNPYSNNRIDSMDIILEYLGKT